MRTNPAPVRQSVGRRDVVTTWRIMSYDAADDRYDDKMPYRRSGRSGLQAARGLPGLWQNFGDGRRSSSSGRSCAAPSTSASPTSTSRTTTGRRYGSAEINFGRLLREDFRPYRDELVISTKAGYDMWPGPYGDWGSRKYLLASLDQSLKRMGLDYVDIFYCHRFDPDTPLEETMGALDTAVRSGQGAVRGHLVLLAGADHGRPHAILRSLGTPLLIHQPSYSMLNRWIEGGLLDTLGELGVGCIAFSPLAQGC